MIVVMPDSAMAPTRFVSELMDDIVPFVEAQFRTRTGPENRAVAGLSAGGRHAIFLSWSAPEAFSALGIWSMGLTEDQIGTYAPQLAATASRLNDHVDLLSISSGLEDTSWPPPSIQPLVDLLDANGIEYELQFTDGGHNWNNWMRYLHEFAPRLFR